MDEHTPDTSPSDIQRRMSVRRKVVQVVGVLLIALGLFMEWPPGPDANVPETSSVLIILGVLLCTAGLLIAWRRE